MKKLFKIIMSMVLIFFLIPIMALAQDGGIIIPGFDVSKYFASLAVFVPIVILISGWLNTLFKTKGFGKQFVTWFISIVLVYVGWLLKLGLFAELTSWWIVAIYGLATGLVANGIFEIKVIQTVLGYIKALGVKSKTE